MPPEEQPRHTSRSKKIGYYTKLFCLILVGCLAIVVMPGIYLMYALNAEQKVKIYNDNGFELEYPGKMKVPPPWYMLRGRDFPNTTRHGQRKLKIWPEEDQSDRIENQLMFKPKANRGVVKTILMYNNLKTLSLTPGNGSFYGCPVKTCYLSADFENIETADAVIFTDAQHGRPAVLGKGRPSQQVWILFLSKNPHFTKDLDYLSGINWTISYRSDSDIVAPFIKWVYYDHSIKQLARVSQNFATGKTKKVVWFVRDTSNDQNRRKEYVVELQKYIDVDVFGNSNPYQCPCVSPQQCFSLMDQYKFSLAFENSHCKEYITAKFYTCLQRGILPVVMGAPLEDYRKFAPYNSYIHVDEFPSPRDLAEYLHKLDKNDVMYNEYFRWRGTGEMIDTRIECRLCALLHSGDNKTYPDVDSWWRDNACKYK